MIATGAFFHIQPSSYVPALAPITHAVMLLIGAINLYVGFTRASDPFDPPPRMVPLTKPYLCDGVPADHNPTCELIGANPDTLPISGGDSARSSNLEDDADSAALAQTARSELDPISTDGSIAPGSNAGSITLASHASDFHESLCDGELDAYFAEEDHGESFSHVNIFMATGDENDDAPDPFSTPLPTNATAEQIEQHRVVLEAQKKKEIKERKKFRLE
jgi:hypothetical protein